MKTTLSSLVQKFVVRFGTKCFLPMPEDDNNLLQDFISCARALSKPKVLELGTMRSIPERSTRHDEWIPNAIEYLGTDISECVDVDIVADVHELSNVIGNEKFDVIISCSTFEHFKYPQLATHQILKVLKPNGLLFIQTHQSFPLHAYPHDYFRFSKEALCALFNKRMGFEVSKTCYNFPAWICSPRELGTVNAHSYLNVCLFGKKLLTTPEEYCYDLD